MFWILIFVIFQLLKLALSWMDCIRQGVVSLKQAFVEHWQCTEFTFSCHRVGWSLGVTKSVLQQLAIKWRGKKNEDFKSIALQVTQKSCPNHISSQLTNLGLWLEWFICLTCWTCWNLWISLLEILPLEQFKNSYPEATLLFYRCSSPFRDVKVMCCVFFF